MNYRPVCTLDDRFEADIIEEALREEGIAFQMVPNQETTMESVFSIQKDWGTVMIREDQIDRAVEIIRAVMEAQPMSEDDEASEAPSSSGGSRDVVR